MEIAVVAASSYSSYIAFCSTEGLVGYGLSVAGTIVHTPEGSWSMLYIFVGADKVVAPSTYSSSHVQYLDKHSPYRSVSAARVSLPR